MAGDDRGVTGRATQGRRERDHQRGVQPGGVDGGQILGAQDRGNLGDRDAGLGQAAELGDDAVADVPQVGHPLGHQPAQLREHGDELLDRASHRPHGGAAAGDPLLGGCDPRPVLRQARGGRQHLRRGAGRVRRTFPQPVRHRGGRSREAFDLTGPLGIGEVTVGRGIVDARPRARPDHGGVLHPAHGRNALQHGSW